jgi:hypothetical protein
MIYTLTVECVFGTYLEEQCIRVIEIEDAASLYALHLAIQDAIDFGRDHPFEFYIANKWNGWKKQWLTEHEEWEEKENDFFRIKLQKIWPLGRKRLYYLFDFGDRWTFEVRKARGAKEPEPEVLYPRVIKSIGPNPEQYPNFEEP